MPSLQTTLKEKTLKKQIRPNIEIVWDLYIYLCILEIVPLFMIPLFNYSHQLFQLAEE